MSRSLRERFEQLCRPILEDSDRGVEDLLLIGARVDADRLLPLLAPLLPEVPDPDLALAHLERYTRAGPLTHDRERFQVLLTLLGFSPYLAESIINDRDQLADLVRARRQGIREVGDYRNELARWLRIAPGGDPWDALRRYKRRVTMRIAVRDLHREATLPDICRELSHVADALIGSALEIVLAALTEKYGRPQSYDESGRILEASMAVLSLGKLGGEELNYSSDIDLLFLYSLDGETTGIAGRPETQVTNRKFFTLAAEALVHGLAHIGAEGRVYRVDCDLRPGGRDGDLVVPLNAALAYYRTWARAWERQALIKARPCAGDLQLGRRFLEGITGIVYPDEPGATMVDEIRAMKDRIDASLARRRQIESHLKLGRGGIREVEFTVQALQIAHGGKDPWIRSPNTLLALHRLTDKGHLSVLEYGALSAAYVFLRETEHRLQLHGNLQRSVLPSGQRQMRMLARSMGYRDSAQRQESANFLADLAVHREAVREIYDAVLGRLSQVSFEESPGPDIFLDPISDTDITARLRSSGIAAPETLIGSVKAIRKLLSTSIASADLRRSFRRMAPALLRELAQVHNPTRALRNTARYLTSISLDPSDLRAVLARSELLPALVPLFAGSQLMTSTLIHRPGLVLEEGFGAAIARDRSVGEHLEKIAEGRPAPVDERSFESFLRVYQRRQLLFIGLKDVNRQVGPAAVGRALSDLAEAIVRACVDEQARRCGWMPTGGLGRPSAGGFVVLGLGKLGYRELDYTTDLDLVFLYDGGGRGAARRHATANRMASGISEMLTAITREGALYAVDTRLRPFGGEGELAQTVARLHEYFSNQADVWEMQSYLKARPVAGDLALGWRTVEELEAQILRRAREVELGRAVQEMKQRLEREAGRGGRGLIDIKHGPGGLIAVQFIIQYLQLRHGIRSPRHKRTTRLLVALRGAGCLDEESYRALFAGFRFLRRLEHRMRLIHGRAVSLLPVSGDALDEIAAGMGFEGARAGESLALDVARHRSRIEHVYRRLVEQTVGP